MPSPADLTAVVQGALGGIGAGLQKREDQRGPEAMMAILKLKQEQQQLDDQATTLKLQRDQNKIKQSEYEQKMKQIMDQEAAYAEIAKTNPMAAAIMRANPNQVPAGVANQLMGVQTPGSKTPDMRWAYEQWKNDGNEGGMKAFLKDWKQSGGAGGGGKSPLTTGQALTAVKGRAKNEITRLKGKEYNFLSPAEYEALDPKQKQGWSLHPQQMRYYKPVKAVQDTIAQQQAYLSDFGAQKQSADSLQALLANGMMGGMPGQVNADSIANPDWFYQAQNPPVGPEQGGGQVTPEIAAQYLREKGIDPNADPADPEVVKDYIYYLNKVGKKRGGSK